MKLKILSFVIITNILSFFSFCTEFQYVVEEDLCLKRSQIQGYIEQIQSSEIGKKLIEKINLLQQETKSKCKEIVFRRGVKTGFYPQNSDRDTKLIFEIAAQEETYYPSLHDPKTDLSPVFEEKVPFWITLSHELIHLKHKLEEIAGISKNDAIDIAYIPYTLAQRIGISDIFIEAKWQYLFEKLPELQELRLNMSELWPNLEERRTVVGPDIDGISEDAIRVEAGLPCRFIYQNKDIKSLEKSTTVAQTLSLCKYILMPITTDFLLEISVLTPIDVLLRSFIKEDIIKTLDDNPINYLTKQIFTAIVSGKISHESFTPNKELLIELLAHTPASPQLIFQW